MTRLSTLPSTREQARHALLLLGVPAPARLVVAVHRALFDGDLDMPALAGLLRAERRAETPVICHGLTTALAPMHVALAEWPLERRIVTPAADRAGLAVSIARIREFTAMRPGASRAAELLLAALDEELTNKGHGVDADADAVTVAAVAQRAAALSRTERLFGVSPVPHQRTPRVRDHDTTAMLEDEDGA